MRLHVNTVIHTSLVGLGPATFRSLVDCWSDALPVVALLVARQTNNQPTIERLRSASSI